MSVAPGGRLGPYEIVELRGRGGMGAVYRARDTRLGRDVAIKVLPPDVRERPGLRERLEREARTISQLQHPHICSLHDVGDEDGELYLVMEYLDGETLEERLRRGPPSFDELVRVGREIAEAVEAAHRRGLVHRDLKPGNVVLTGAGAKVLDFGLARERGAGGLGAESELATEAAPLTAEGAIVGTLHYMAPEQLEGRAVDARADLWALGCLLYEMASGDRPFRGESAASLIGSILKDTPAPLWGAARLVPRRLDALVRRALAKDPERRWQSARDVALELEELARPTEEGEGAAPARPRAAMWVGSLVATAALTALALRLLPGGPDAAPERPEVRLRPLTGRPASDTIHSASLAPDGETLAFATEAGLFLQLVATGEEQQVPLPDDFSVHEVDWLAGGSTLLFTAALGDEVGLYRTSVFGGAPVKLADGAARAAVSPDGRQVAWLEEPPSRQIHLMDADGDDLRVLAQGEGGNSFWELAWSPDARWLLAGRWDGSKTLNTSLLAIDAASGETREVLSDPRFFQNWRAFLPFAWTATGELIVARREPPPSELSSNLWRVAIDRESAQTLGPLERLTQVVGVNVKDISVRSDGDGVSFLLERNQNDVLVADLASDGGLAAVQPLAADEREERPLGWAIDQRSLFLKARRSEGGWGLYRAPLDGERVQALAAGEPADRLLELTPDGRSVTYWVLSDLQQVPVDGGPVRTVLAAGEWPGHRCSSDRTRCLMGDRSADGRWYTLYVLNWESGRGEEVLRFENQSPFTNWDLSPDGTRIATSGSDGRLRLFDLATGEETVIEVPGWKYGEFPAWDAAGRGVYIDGGPAARYGSRRGLLHISTDGTLRSLRQNWNEWITFPVPSRDGRRLAFASQRFSANVWLLETR